MPCGQGKLSLQSLFVADGTPVVLEGEKATASQVGRDRDGRGVSSAASMEAA